MNIVNIVPSRILPPIRPSEQTTKETKVRSTTSCSVGSFAEVRDTATTSALSDGVLRAEQAGADSDHRNVLLYKQALHRILRVGTVGIPAQVPEKCKAEPQAIDAPPRLCEPRSNKRGQDSHRRRHPPSESPEDDFRIGRPPSTPT